jgi:TolA-binding protein
MPENVRFPGMTPEMLTIYDLALQQTEAYQLRLQHQREVREQQERQREQRQQRRAQRDEERRVQERQSQRGRRQRGSAQGDEGRLRDALHMGGGELREFRDRGEFWQVEWMTRNGDRHTSAISKGDLTVISSGICLSGYDRNFDLQSLVGVIEARDNWDF